MDNVDVGSNRTDNDDDLFGDLFWRLRQSTFWLTFIFNICYYLFVPF